MTLPKSPDIKPDFVIRELTPAALKIPGTTDPLIRAYRDVFGREPWGEWQKCNSCSRKLSLEESSRKPPTLCCNSPQLSDFHPPTQVNARLYAELAHPNSFLFNAQTNEEVVGFTWGFGANLTDTASHVLESYFPHFATTENISATATQLQLQLQQHQFPSQVSFISEFGVRFNHRGGTVMAQLMQAEGQRAIANQHPTYLFWTDPQSRIYSVINLMGGAQILDFKQFDPAETRVIMAGDFNRLNQIITDHPGDQLQRYFLQQMRINRAENRQKTV